MDLILTFEIVNLKGLLTSKFGLKTKIFTTKSIRSNNAKCLLADTNHGKFFVKKFLNNNNNLPNIRFIREVFFYLWIKNSNIRGFHTPKLITMDFRSNYIVLEYIPSIKADQAVITESIIKMFEYLINLRVSAQDYPVLASEASFYLMDHYNHLESRIERFSNSKSSKILGRKKQEEIYKTWRKVKKFFFLKKEYFECDLIAGMRMLSLGDFGNHNTIKAKTKLYFVDFEYAGLDGVIKAYLDFTTNPSNLINEISRKKLLMSMIKMYDCKKLVDILEFLTPLYKLKWGLISLNPIFNKYEDMYDEAIKKSTFLIQSI